MAQTRSDNILADVNKLLDDKTGVAGNNPAWRPYNNVAEFVTRFSKPGTTNLIGAAEGQFFWVRSTTDANKADLYSLRKDKTPYKVLGDIDISVFSILTTISNIRDLSGELKSNYYTTTDKNQEGNWYYDSTDTTSLDNTGTILVTSDGKRIKRIYAGEVVFLDWFGADKTGELDTTDILIKALSVGKSIQCTANAEYKFNGSVKKIGSWPSIIGKGATFIQNSQVRMLNPIGRFGDIVPVISYSVVSPTYITTTRKVTQINVTSTSGFMVGDLVRIYSDDLDTRAGFPNATLGETFTISEIATDQWIRTSAPLRRGNLYVNNVRISRSLRDTCYIEGLNFTTADGVTPINSGNASNAYIYCSGMYKPIFQNLYAYRGYGNIFVPQSCYGAIFLNVKARDLADKPVVGQYGYFICDANSEFTQVDGIYGENTRHMTTTNAYRNITDSDYHEATNHGYTFGMSVTNGYNLGGGNAAFDAHDGADQTTFKNLLVVGIGYRPVTPQSDNNQPNGFAFQFRGKNSKGYNLRAIDCYGGASLITSSTITNPDNWSDVELFDCDFETYGPAVFADKFTDCILHGKFIRDDNFDNDSLFKARNSALGYRGIVLDRVSAKNKFTNQNNNGVVYIRNSSFEIIDSKIDASYENLDGTGRLINYRGFLVRITQIDNSGYTCKINGLEVTTGRVTMDGLIFISTDVVDANPEANTYIQSIAENVSILKKSGTITVSPSGTQLSCGIINNIPENRIFANISTGNCIQKNCRYITDDIVIENFNSQKRDISTSTESLIKYISKIGDDSINISLNNTSGADVALNSFRVGKFINQKLSIFNMSVNNSFTLSTVVALTRLPFPLVIKPNQIVSFTFNGSVWVLDDVSQNTTATNNSTTVLSKSLLNAAYANAKTDFTVKFPFIADSPMYAYKLDDSPTGNWMYLPGVLAI